MLHHHPESGEGEQLQRILPFTVTHTDFIIPTVEEALLGELTKKGLHRKFASCIFRNTIQESLELLKPWLHHPRFNLLVCEKICKQSEFDLDAYLNNKSLHVDVDELSHPPAWTSRMRPIFYEPHKHDVWATVWIRVNCAYALFRDHKKVMHFINAHLEAVRFLDDHGPESTHVPYSGCGDATQYDDCRNFIQKSITSIQTRPTPLQVLRRVYPQKPWTLEEVTEPDYDLIQQHNYAIPTADAAALHIMVQCKILHATAETAETRDVLWFYHCCFLDYVFDKKPETEVEFLTRYPYDTRAFTSYDLPDVFHVLYNIPLWGEQVEPTFQLGLFIRKSLPFAGARRTLIDKIDETLETDTSFWRIFSAVFYCMLCDMYPEHLSFGKQRMFDLKYLKRARELCNDRHLLREVLARNSETHITTKERDKGCYFVFTAFRMWIVLLADNQKHYIDGISDCFDWNVFVTQTIKTANIIRHTNIYADVDAFKEAREILSKNNKNSKTKVYRYRKSNLVDTVLDLMMEGLEKDLFKELDSWQLDFEMLRTKARVPKTLHPNTSFADAWLECEKQIRMHTEAVEIDDAIKQKVINTLIRVPATDWTKPICLSIMRLQQYGGVAEDTIQVLLHMIGKYYTKDSKPKNYEMLMGMMRPRDFVYATWYFHVVSLLNRITFEALPMHQVQQTDEAMLLKYAVFPRQDLSPFAYDVFFTLCCNRIKTLMGSNVYGHEDIAYDIERDVFLCAKKTKKSSLASISLDEEFDTLEKQRKKVKSQRKKFNHIPCKTNPALRVNLRGFRLIIDKTTSYTHCPQCGGFHVFSWTGFWRDKYYCPTCRHKIEANNYYTCTYCTLPAVPTCVITVMDPLNVNGVMEAFQTLYLCKEHYNKAKKKSVTITTKDVFFK